VPSRLEGPRSSAAAARWGRSAYLEPPDGKMQLGRWTPALPAAILWTDSPLPSGMISRPKGIRGATQPAVSVVTRKGSVGLAREMPQSSFCEFEPFVTRKPIWKFCQESSNILRIEQKARGRRLARTCAPSSGWAAGTSSASPAVTGDETNDTPRGGRRVQHPGIG
jgi:hypothetical protein